MLISLSTCNPHNWSNFQCSLSGELGYTRLLIVLWCVVETARVLNCRYTVEIMFLSLYNFPIELCSERSEICIYSLCWFNWRFFNGREARSRLIWKSFLIFVTFCFYYNISFNVNKLFIDIKEKFCPSLLILLLLLIIILFKDDHILNLKPETVDVRRRMREFLDD